MTPRSSPKRAVVLAIGLDKPTPEIIAAAKKRGVHVTGSYVRLLRHGRTSGRTSSAPAKRSPRGASEHAKAIAKAAVKGSKAKAKPPGKRRRTAEESAFLRAALRIGLARAKELLRGLEETLASYVR